MHGYDECRYPICVAVVGAGLGLLALRSLADRHVDVGDLGRGHHHAREVLAELALAACWGRVLASRRMAPGQVQDRVAGPPRSQLVATTTVLSSPCPVSVRVSVMPCAPGR